MINRIINPQEGFKLPVVNGGLVNGDFD